MVKDWLCLPPDATLHLLKKRHDGGRSLSALTVCIEHAAVSLQDDEAQFCVLPLPSSPKFTAMSGPHLNLKTSSGV